MDYHQLYVRIVKVILKNALSSEAKFDGPM